MKNENKVKRQYFVVILIVGLVFISVETIIGDQFTPQKLLKNLKTKTFTGEAVSLFLRDAPIRNLFEYGKGPIPPTFPTSSGLKFKVADDVKVKVSIQADGVCFDKVLYQILQTHKLTAVIQADYILIRRQKGKIS